MPGTREGGLKAAAKVKATRPDFYTQIGRIGGLKSKGGGFFLNRELAARAGAIGGRNSHCGKSKPKPSIDG